MQTANETLLPDSMMRGLGEIRILHPPGTWTLTPASLTSLHAIARKKALLKGDGIDWGTGTGCLAIAAASVANVRRVIGMDISGDDVAIAKRNAALNGVDDKTTFFAADSYSPTAEGDRSTLESLSGRATFILANPPSSEGDDGFAYRRVVLSGARRYLDRGGVVFLSVSSQYGQQRTVGLCDDVPGFVYGGVLSSTEWVPFDLERPDLLQCLHQYAAEEERGGLPYSFRKGAAGSEEPTDARSALSEFEANGERPLMKWQTLLFEFDPK